MSFSNNESIQVLRRIDLKSDEEYWFYMWLLEAVEFGFISSFIYEPESHLLCPNVTVSREILQKTKTKLEDAALFESHSRDGEGVNYTPDFVFTLTDKGMIYFGDNVFWQTCQHQVSDQMTAFVDVKGTYNPYGGGNQVFFLKRRLMWDVYGIFIHKITLSRGGSWFKRTWAPEGLRWMKSRRVPTLSKMGRNTIDSKTYTHKFAWRMTASSQADMFK